MSSYSKLCTGFSISLLVLVLFLVEVRGLSRARKYPSGTVRD